MNLLLEIISIVFAGLKQFSIKGLTLTIASATVISGLCWAFGNYYALLWNKRFHLTATLQILNVLASLLTFFFVLAFAAMAFLQPIAIIKIGLWRININNDVKWGNDTFKEAYYAVKKGGLENFSAYPIPEKKGNRIPLAHTGSQLVYASTFANNAAENFNDNHPFLGKVIWSSKGISKDTVKVDIENWFKFREGPYPAENAINLASAKILSDLAIQTPRVVKLSRLVLVGMFLVVIFIPFALIGYAAYTDIKVRV